MWYGKWYLLCSDYDRLGKKDPNVTTKVELTASSLDAAMIEARRQWSKRLAQGTYKGGAGNTIVFPRDPRLSYEESL